MFVRTPESERPGSDLVHPHTNTDTNCLTQLDAPSQQCLADLVPVS